MAVRSMTFSAGAFALAVLLCGCPSVGGAGDGTDAGAGRADARLSDAGAADAATQPADAEALPGDDAGEEAPDAEGGKDAARKDGGARDASGPAGLDAGLPVEPDAGEVGAPDAAAPAVDASHCTTPVAAPDVDTWRVRAPSLGWSNAVMQSSGGHDDIYFLSPAPDADYTRIGVRLDWGGAIVFYGLSADPNSNVIDANDTGRELQVAIYDPQRNRQGCAFDASCLTSSVNCGNSITYLGWNPVQGGDECNRGARATYFLNGDTLRIVVTPVQWNPDWDAPDCRSTPCAGAAREAGVEYMMELRYVDKHVVEVALRVESKETIDHQSTAQEFPTLYVSHGAGGPDLLRLLDAGGNLVAIDQPANDGFTVKSFASPAEWVTFQDASSTYGVALAMDQGIRDWQGWAGDGTNAPYFHNVRAQIAFGLQHGGRVHGISYLALGSYSTVKSAIESVLAKRPPFGLVDQPAEGTVAQGASVLVAGWVLDTAKVATVDVEVDGAIAATLPVTASRQDVCAAFPGYSGCPDVGFVGQVSTAGLDECVHLMRVVATDADGNRTVLGERLVRR